MDTMSWFYLFNGSTNPQARKYYVGSGIQSGQIEKSSMSYTSSLLNGRLGMNPHDGEIMVRSRDIGSHRDDRT